MVPKIVFLQQHSSLLDREYYALDKHWCNKYIPNTMCWLILPPHSPLTCNLQRCKAKVFQHKSFYIYRENIIAQKTHNTSNAINLKQRRMNFFDWKIVSKNFCPNNILLCLLVHVMGTFRFLFRKVFFSTITLPYIRFLSCAACPYIAHVISNSCNQRKQKFGKFYRRP